MTSISYPSRYQEILEERGLNDKIDLRNKKQELTNQVFELENMVPTKTKVP